MTPEQARIVRASWNELSHRKADIVTAFYAALFRMDPALRPLFGTDMVEQRRMLSAALNVAVSSVERIEEVSGSLRDLGRRHVHYGARVEHYNLFAEALIEALRECDDLKVIDARAEAAWRRAIDVMSREMLAGAEGR